MTCVNGGLVLERKSMLPEETATIECEPTVSVLSFSLAFPSFGATGDCAGDDRGGHPQGQAPVRAAATSPQASRMWRIDFILGTPSGIRWRRITWPLESSPIHQKH
jgi:hypothetical protein